jgi:hypothetical protein
METNPSLDTLKDIRSIMERSSKFISLSGWSGISAGVCALVGAWFAHAEIVRYYNYGYHNNSVQVLGMRLWQIDFHLLQIALFTLLAAGISSFLFTFRKAKKNNLSVWDSAAKRLMWNVCVPLAVGGVFVFRLMQLGDYGMIAPACLIFYGLALVNASKYTLGEVRYLGYGMLVLGLINCWFIGYGLYFWAIGFGILHIAYGIGMWLKYEKD